MDNQPRVIIINNLDEWMNEVAVPGVARLNLSERYLPGDIIPRLQVNLDLMGENFQKEIIWLRYTQTLDRTPGGDEFWTPRDLSIYNEMRKMKDLVAEFLQARGYTVRPGVFGIPDNIKSIRGIFTCVRWEKQADETYRVLPRAEVEVEKNGAAAV